MHAPRVDKGNVLHQAMARLVTLFLWVKKARQPDGFLAAKFSEHTGKKTRPKLKLSSPHQHCRERKKATTNNNDDTRVEKPRIEKTILEVVVQDTKSRTYTM